MQKALPKDAHIDVDVDEVIRSCVAKFMGVLTKEVKQQLTLARHKVLQSEDIINAVHKLGFEDSSIALSLFLDRFSGATNRSLPQQVQLPMHTSELIPTEIQQQGNINVPNQGISRGDPTSSLQYWGNATMLPHPSLALPSWPVPMQQTQLERTMWGALNPQISVNPDTMPCSMNMQPPFAPMQQQGPLPWDQLFHQPIPPRSDERFSQQVPMQMMNPQLHTEGCTSNQQARAASFLNAPPFTQPMNQPAFLGYTQMASRQQNVGGYSTNMPADGILGTGAGNAYYSPLDQEMTDADIAYVLDLLKD
ncbi:uncharacterized protein LOC144552382 isoform X2 [Carex rostrata]